MDIIGNTERLKAASDTLEPVDREGYRIYYVKIGFIEAQKALATAVEVDESILDIPAVAKEMAELKVDREDAFKQLAVELLRRGFVQAGFTKAEMDDAVLVECRRIDAAEALSLSAQYEAKREIEEN